jgi:hypothetical protein
LKTLVQSPFMVLRMILLMKELKYLAIHKYMIKK